jgi:DNA-binding NtrC family response regulator
MPRHIADEMEKCLTIALPASSELCAIQVTGVEHLVGHALATIERELILQTLRYHQGNRTRAASMLEISVRSLRDKVRIYRQEGASVPEPGSTCSDSRSQPFTSSLIDSWQASKRA